MELILSELTRGMPSTDLLFRMLLRIGAATIFGAVIGLQRATAGKAAGLRTHVLVAVGTCILVVACEGAGFSNEGLSRLVQGIVTGIGFLGAGTILKMEDEREVHGLTTSAGIWMTAAIGVATGLGTVGIALVATLLTLLVLAFVGRLEYRMNLKTTADE